MPDGESMSDDMFAVLLIRAANKNLTLNAVAGAAFGAAGQRCMALSVGESGHEL
jgi:malonate-semialdehyde dehydrogenase (acetylating)/methylmalonate-semialdehyde dehydrogenase